MSCHRLLNPPLVLLVFLVLLPAAHLLFPGFALIPGPWRLFGLVVVIAGFGLNIVADELFKRARTSIKPTARPSSLVTTGPYAFSRNPMYLGFGLLVVGIAVLLGSAVPLVLAAFFFPLTDFLFIRFEEGVLETGFGPAWTDYATRVRRWV